MTENGEALSRRRLSSEESELLYPEPQWFALVVKPRHEKAVDAILQAKGLDSFLPLCVARRRWADRYKDVEVPLFPGYAFCRFDPTSRLKVLGTPGLVDVVRIGRDFAVIPEDEIAALKRAAVSGLRLEPWPHLGAGGVVQLQSGPLAGLSGTVLEVKKSMRLVLSVHLLNRSVLVEIDRDWVRPLPSRILPSEDYVWADLRLTSAS